MAGNSPDRILQELLAVTVVEDNIPAMQTPSCL